MTDKELMQEEMRMAVRWAASSTYWSERLREFFGPDARDGIAALERQLRDAREELAKLQAQPEREAHAVIAGALFDFMGWITSREERIVLSSTDDAVPAVEAIKQFAKMRGLGLSDANVQGWVKDRTANLGEIMGTEQLRQEMKQPEKTNQCAETCERAKLCAVCGVSLNQEQGAVAWVYTNAKGRAVIVESDVKPYEDAMPLFKSEPQPEQEKTK